MKAVIVAGGKGTRLASVAKDIPKALVPVGKKPIIEHQITLLAKHGILDICILIGHLGDQIKAYLGDGKKWGVNISYSHEQEPLGTAGALLQIADNLKEDFLFLSGDIMMDFDVKKFIGWHKKKKNAIASLVVHSTDHPLDSDLVEVGHGEKIAKLFLKPHVNGPNTEGLGISAVSILSPAVLAHIPRGIKSNFEKDVLPLVLADSNAVYAYNTPEYIKDMGTPERLEKVNKDYEKQSFFS
jgi:NDP-sugar pyrophosphorylase family protein